MPPREVGLIVFELTESLTESDHAAGACGHKTPRVGGMRAYTFNPNFQTSFFSLIQVPHSLSTGNSIVFFLFLFFSLSTSAISR